MPRGTFTRTIEIKSKYWNDKHPNWKGEDVSYSGVHKWLVRHKGPALCCELEDETCSSHYEWSNKDGKYGRDFNDWQQLCVSHHRRYDGNGVGQKRLNGRFA